MRLGLLGSERRGGGDLGVGGIFMKIPLTTSSSAYKRLYNNLV